MVPNVGGTEIVLLIALALLLFGGALLPKLGRGVREFNKELERKDEEGKLS